MAHIIGTPNDDILDGTPDSDLIQGLEGDDSITGGAGNDTLDGGPGFDSMAGGPGDDVYYVDIGPYLTGGHGGGDFRPGERPVENASEGTDEVRVVDLFSLPFELPANVEHLTLIDGDYGKGNDLRNVLIGNNEDNYLQGLGEGDTLVGGVGIDTALYWDSATGVTVSLLTNTGNGGNAEGDTLSGIENLVGSLHSDNLTGDSGANYLAGEEGDDTLVGGAGNDSFDGAGHGYSAGNDFLDGGDGIDSVDYVDFRNYFELRPLFGVLEYNGQLVVGSVQSGLDRLTSIETLTFEDPISRTPLAVTRADSVLEYIASYDDLITAFGTDAAAGFDHFTRTGYAEGRTVPFEGLEYIASYADLIDAFGANVDAGATHYIGAGHAEGRQVTFNGLEYIASYGDLINAFGSDAHAGANHFILSGHSEGRGTTFNGLEYIASYDDLISRFSTEAQTGTTSVVEDLGASHYIRWGHTEQRALDLFDANQYLANYPDLQAAFGTDTDAATLHYLGYGYHEGRTDYPGGVQVVVGTDGDDFLESTRIPVQISGLGGNDSIYGWLGDDALNGGPGNDDLVGDQGNDTASYSGLRSQYVLLKNDGAVVVASVADGLDHVWSTEILSFADQSLSTTRVDTALEYIASYTDLMAAFGADAAAGFDHFARTGYAEGRTVPFDGLEYIASYPDLIRAFHEEVAATADPDIGANHYIAAGHAEQRTADLFDAAQYLANYADLQASFGTDTEAATIHYITTGYFEDRTDHLI